MLLNYVVACPPNCGNVTTSVEQSLLTSSLGIPEFLLTRTDSQKARRQHEKNIPGERNFLQVLEV